MIFVSTIKYQQQLNMDIREEAENFSNNPQKFLEKYPDSLDVIAPIVVMFNDLTKDTMEVLLSHGWNVDMPSDAYQAEFDNKTALDYACEHRNHRIMKLLLDQGARGEDPYTRYFVGHSAGYTTNPIEVFKGTHLLMEAEIPVKFDNTFADNIMDNFDARKWERAMEFVEHQKRDHFKTFLLELKNFEHAYYKNKTCTVH